MADLKRLAKAERQAKRLWKRLLDFGAEKYGQGWAYRTATPPLQGGDDPRIGLVDPRLWRAYQKSYRRYIQRKWELRLAAKGLNGAFDGWRHGFGFLVQEGADIRAVANATDAMILAHRR